MSRIRRALVGFVIGVLMVVSGAVVGALGFVLVSAVLCIAGAVVGTKFLLLYDVDPPSKAGVP